jgi:hypothetical protein
VSSDDLDLVRRLLEEPGGPPGDAASSTGVQRDIPPPPEPPEGATFVLRHEDWDQLGERSTLNRAAAAASSIGRRGWTAAGPSLRHAARLLIFAAAVIGAVAGFGVAVFHVVNDPLADARAYYDAATRLNAGHALYPAGADPDAATFYRYPPLLAIVLRPLALLPYEAFALVWEGVILLSFVLLLRHLGVRSTRTWLAVGLLGIPIGYAFAVAQAQLPMTLLLAIGQPWSIALAANITLFPALAALWWVGRRDWQATIAFVLYSVLLGLVQLLVEPRGTVAFLGTVGLDQVGHLRNLSPYAISPELWVALLAAGIAATVVLARTRWGWPAAVGLVTLASPRLLMYMLTSLLASLRQPAQANLPEPESRPWRMVSGSGRH